MSAPADAICFSHLRWRGFVFQRPNHLLSRCAAERRTFFWEEPVFHEGALAGGAHVATRRDPCGIFVVTPHLPAQMEEGQIEQELRHLLERLMNEESIRQPILWFYTPMAMGFTQGVGARAVIYDCMDELSAFRGAPPPLRAREADLLARADVVFTGGKSLYEAKRRLHPRVYAFPSSVDVTHFAAARQGNTAPPPDQAGIGRPRIGYFGVIDERIDLDLIASIADSNRRWQVVMIGPTAKINPEHLPRRHNIHYLGLKEYDELPAYIAGWDVAIMPFALNEATEFISPTKTLEYLAAGKPVVSTAVRDVVTPYGDMNLVRIADRDSMAHEIAAALAETSPARQAAADALVAQTSWDNTWRDMWTLVERVCENRSGGTEQHKNEREDGHSTCSTISS